MSRRPLLLLAALVCVCSSMLLGAAEAKTHHHTWDISYQYKSLDCFEKLAVTVNGESPGPTIHAARGDTVVVTVRNKLETENTAIHWHGIRQIGTPWADGVSGVTQCPILPGETFTYRFVVDRAGTYLYHAHYGMQRVAGLNGMIVVTEPAGAAVEPFTYDGEHTVLLGDWWHKSVYEQATGLSSNPFVFVTEPQSLLINGRGTAFNCSQLGAPTGSACNASSSCALPPAAALFTFVPGKTYLVRIGSLASLSSLSFEIEGHSMTVVEADGHYVKPFVVRNLFVYSGETYSVLVKADQDPARNYWAASHIVGRDTTKTPIGKAVVSYSSGANGLTTPPPTAPPAGPVWNDTAIRVAQSRAIVAHPAHVIPAPARPDRTLLLLNKQARVDGHLKWAINGVSLAFPSTPFLVSMKRGLTGAYDPRPPPDTYTAAGADGVNATVRSAAYRLGLGSVVDVVLQNAEMLSGGNRSETHPWHLHGHDFWVLAHGDGEFDPAADGGRLVLDGRDGQDRPIMKNTVPLHPHGWTAIRFRADNPGVWLFHCHLEAHVYMGMGVVFEEGVDKVGRLPASIMGCGRSKGLRH
ncbi:L-ascorbate oxidase [Brachypodium distachyon]|uniref:L-ascorbate oxidase n=1 Tax=Brachypodium distachyon TaxID=15368 RepID=I1IRL8_BRADI|nr:L-ascorbate oxidase [Brachypodium distachyon]KQJ90932.1 hypothetical protein BRADI_4g34690v3 [Brachypodium distachyon]|eukprot:XP_003576719.1 L-ascorbate oxidase [Brachypodium distachyon]